MLSLKGKGEHTQGKMSCPSVNYDGKSVGKRMWKCSFSFSVKSSYYIRYRNGNFTTLPRGKIIIIKYAMIVKLTDLDSRSQHIRKEIFCLNMHWLLTACVLEGSYV